MPESKPLPTAERLFELIAAMQGQPVLMLVDLVADRFVLGSAKRISREAPVLILRFEDEVLTPGGGANAVANVAALGGRPLSLGAVGNDENGRLLLERLRELEIETAGMVEIEGFRTPTKTRILGGGPGSSKQQIVRYDIEDHLQFDDALRAHFERCLATWNGMARVAVLSDYGYGAVSPDLLGSIRSSLSPESTILCDSRYRLTEFVEVDGATPNVEEVESLLGIPVRDNPQLMGDAGRKLLERLRARFLLVTRGSRGMSLFENGGALHIPVHGTDQVADVTGAGDTVIGAFALATAAGGSPVEAALLANYAGGVVVMKMGTATVTVEELKSAVELDRGLLEAPRWDQA